MTLESRKGLKYSYIGERISWFKALYVIGIFSWIFLSLNYVYLFNHSVWYWVVFGPIVGVLILSTIISKIIHLHYTPFDMKHHTQLVERVHKQNFYPTIDVFLPVAGEPLPVLINTWEGVCEMRNHYKGLVQVYVLDDKGLDSVRDSSRQFHFNYISRPNKGEMKKAGNIKYAFDRTGGEFIVIFDADFRPQPDFLQELIPYFHPENSRDDGSTIGIVQSPQCFDIDESLAKKQPLAYGAATIQTYFYKYIQTARQEFGEGAICVGSNAIYRRKALDSIGGTAQIEHSEDVWTGFKIREHGWRLKYIPLCLAFGDCPDNAQSFYKQQSRWCSGSMSLLTSKDFWKAKFPLTTKLCFMSGFLFYISTVCFLTLPTISIVSALSLSATVAPWWYFMLVGIFAINSVLLLSFHIYPKWRFSTMIAHLTATWSYAFTIINLLFKKRESWQPSGAKFKLDKNYVRLRKTVIIYLMLLMLAFLIVLIKQSQGFAYSFNNVFYVWIGFNMLNQCLALYGMYKYT
jgi:cellulose synthase (UDP-forming)